MGLRARLATISETCPSVSGRLRGSTGRRGRQSLLIGVLLVACGGDDLGTATDASSSTASEETGTVTGGPLPQIGAMCDHDGELDFEPGFHLSRDEAGCASGLCVYIPDGRVKPGACVVDSDCNIIDPERTDYVCSDGVCEVSTAYKHEGSMCTQTCETDADCLPVDLQTTCISGIACVIASPTCCEKLCLCTDNLSAGGIDEATAMCAMDATPDCPR